MDWREGDLALLPSQRVACVKQVFDDGDYVRLRYLDIEIIAAADRDAAEVTIHVKYLRRGHEK